METIKSVGISLLILFFSILIKVTTTSVTDINVINNDPYQIIMIGFDLILISLSMLFGAYFSTRSSSDNQADLFKPLVGIFGLTLICFALVALCKSNMAFVKSNINLLGYPVSSRYPYILWFIQNSRSSTSSS